MKVSLVGCMVVGLVTAQALGDAVPRSVPRDGEGPREVKLEVQMDAGMRTAQLYIPADLLGRKQAWIAPGVSTVAIGLALAAALVTGGWWLSRRGKYRGTVAAASLVLTFAAMGSVLVADVIPPPGVSVQTVNLPADVRLPESVTVQTGPAGGAIRLVLPAPRRRAVEPFRDRPPGAGEKAPPPGK